MQYTAHALAVHPSEQRAQIEPSVQRDAWAEERTIGSSNRPKLLAMFLKLRSWPPNDGVCMKNMSAFNGRLFAGRGQRKTVSTGRATENHQTGCALRASSIISCSPTCYALGA